MSSPYELVYHFEPRVNLGGVLIGWKLHRPGDPDYSRWPATKFNTVAEALDAAERTGVDALARFKRADGSFMWNPETGAPTPARLTGLPRADGLDFEEKLNVMAAVRAAATSGLPTDSAARKALPIFSGVLNYFPDALAAVAQVSKIGNDQHNPGQPLHWSKGKSTDHDDCAVRHLIDAKVAPIDTDGGRHRAKHAWRALAALQIEIEAERAGLSYADYIAELEKLA